VTTATAWLRELAADRGDAIAIVEPDGLGLPYAELERRAARLAGGLRARGLERGDRIASLVPNGALPVELILASARLGAVTVGVNTRYRADDLRHLLERARPRLLVSTDDFLGIDFRGIVAAALDGLGSPPELLWPEAVEELREAAAFDGDAAEPSDLLVAFTTSGTTGLPKLAAHDHVTTLRHLRAAARSLSVDAQSVALLGLPLCGTFGFVTLFAVLAGGGRVVVPTRFEPAGAAALMEEHRVTHFNGSDDMLLGVLDAGRDLSCWRHGVHADFNGLGMQSVARAEAVGARVTGVYGSSETFALLARWSPADPVTVRGRNGGVPVDPAVEVRVVDPGSGEPLAPGEVGELQIRGPSVLQSYLVGPGTVPRSVTADGWFATGDLGMCEPGEGFVYVARSGDALRLSGFLTDPAEIEQRLLRHPSVSGAQVVGATSPRGSERAIAFVTTTGPVSEADLVDHCRAGLANYKVPARVVVVDEFPTVAGANGVKIRKTELRERAAALGDP
jgi:fatty-acyl-CoA synthase